MQGSPLNPQLGSLGNNHFLEFSRRWSLSLTPCPESSGDWQEAASVHTGSQPRIPCRSHDKLPHGKGGVFQAHAQGKTSPEIKSSLCTTAASGSKLVIKNFHLVPDQRSLPLLRGQNSRVPVIWETVIRSYKYRSYWDTWQVLVLPWVWGSGQHPLPLTPSYPNRFVRHL